MGTIQAPFQIYFIRHGEVDFPKNTSGERLVYGSQVPLSYEGRMQAQSLGSRLEKSGIQYLYSSFYPRAVQTAQIIAGCINATDDTHKLRVPVSIIPDLRDSRYPSWEGVPMAEVEKVFGDLYAVNQPGQEPLRSVEQRARNVIDHILALQYEGPIGIVSHGDTIGAMMWYLEHIGEKEAHIQQYTDITTDPLAKACARLWQLEENRWIQVATIEHGRPLEGGYVETQRRSLPGERK